MVNPTGARVLAVGALSSRILNSGMCALQNDPAVGRRPRWWRLAIAAEVGVVLATVAVKRRYPRSLLYANAAAILADTAVLSSTDQELAGLLAAGGRGNELAVTSACALGLSPQAALLTAVASAVWAAALLRARRRGQDISAGTVLAATVDPIWTYLGCAYAAEPLRRFDSEAAAYREAAERRAGETAARAEAAERDRVLHDVALQTLEAVAGGWQVDPDILRRRAGADADRLERLLDGTWTDTSGLQDGLTALAAQAAAWPLHVQVDADTDTDTDTALDPETTNAILDATRELLTNVAKHSGQTRARISVTTGTSDLTVTVSDTGRGYDPNTNSTGLGLRHSVTGRIRDAGGTVHITTATGQGTTVTLSIPTN